VVIGGDFNARVGGEGGGYEGEEGESRERKTKDRVVNAEGRKLVNWIEENGWSIFNGSMRGDEEGEYTFTGGKGNTIIDFIIRGEVARERVEKMRIGARIDSDHHPVEMVVGRKG